MLISRCHRNDARNPSSLRDHIISTNSHTNSTKVAAKTMCIDHFTQRCDETFRIKYMLCCGVAGDSALVHHWVVINEWISALKFNQN